MSYPSNRADSVAQDQIRAFVERILRLKEEAKAINGDIREVYAEAKSNGFDKTVLGKLVSYIEKRQSGAADLQEAEALFDLYLSAYDAATGTSLALTHTHEGKPKLADLLVGVTKQEEAITGSVGREFPAPEHDAETGEITETSSQPDASFAKDPRAGEGFDTSLAGVEGEQDRHPISEPALVPREIAEPGDGRAVLLPSAAPVVPTIRPHNPGTHFLNSDNLMRLHGCLNPDMCGSSTPRVKLCSTCTAKLGPVAA